MDKQNRLLTLLALVLLVGVAFLVLDPRRDQPREEVGDGPPTHALFGLKADDVVAFSISARDRSLAFVKEGGTWKLRDGSVAVDQRKVSEVVDRFVSLKVEERDLKGDDAAFGLDEAQRVELKLTDTRGEDHFVWVGADTSVGYRTYLRETTNGPVGLASAKVGDLVQRSLADFRSREVWTFSTATARRIVFEGGGDPIVLRKDDHGWWLGDAGPRADDDAVRNWMYSVESLRAETFLDGQEPAAVGLVPAAATVRIEDDTGTHTLQLGPPDPLGRAALGEHGLVRLTPDAVDPVKRDGWLATRLLPVRRIQIDRLSVALGPVKGTWTRKDGVWSDANGNPSIAVDGLLDRIEAVTVDRAAPTSRPTEVWGTLTLAEGDTREEQLQFGPAVDGVHAAIDLAGGPPFAVAAADLATLASGVPAASPPAPAAPAETPAAPAP